MNRKELAPAKINLALDILGRREDGYHELRMVMQTVSLCDEVTVRPGQAGFALLADGFAVPAGKKPLEQQATEAFFTAIRQPVPPLTVELRKVTPAYAGLGGGSADVAALLRCLRRDWAPEMTDDALRAVGLQVGSDMPFCITGGTALAEGRGERLRDLTPLPDCAIVLCKPDFGIPTPALFALADGAPPRHRPDIDGMMTALEQGDLAGVAGRLGNVFEEVLPREYHAVFHIKERLLALGALNAAMSGSGPTVFGIFREEAAARGACARLKGDYPQTYLAKPVGKLV